MSSKLEKSVKYIFKDKELLKTALTHRSLTKKNNEQLEYLGDAILGFVIADVMLQRFPQATEDELTRLRVSLVKEEALAKLARELKLGDYLRLGAGEIKNNGQQRDSILANAFEALVGAIYLDAGIEKCRQCILAFYNILLLKASPYKLNKDPKTTLQELLQSKNQSLPMYDIVAERVEPNAHFFTINCHVPDWDVSVRAQGRSKRVAEQLAAEKALALLKSLANN